MYSLLQYEGEGNMNDDVMVQLLSGMIQKPCFHQVLLPLALVLALVSVLTRHL